MGANVLKWPGSPWVLVVQWIERPPGVPKVMGSNPMGTQIFSRSHARVTLLSNSRSCFATFPSTSKILCCLSYFQLSVTVFSVFENVLKHGLKCLVLVPKQVCLGLVMEDISTKPIQPLIRSVCFHFQSSQFHTMHPLQTYAMSCKTLLTLLSSLIILRAVTDECFKFCASLIISSARFSCMFWWYCSTASILSSFVSPFLSPVNLLQRHESIHKVKS